MRKKIEELRNKEEGFTLVELLAVLVILAIIVAIAVPAVGNVISNSETKAQKAEAELVMDSARLYFTAEEGKTKETEVKVSELLSTGYLEQEPQYNAKGDNAKVTRTKQDSGGYVYSYDDFTSDEDNENK